MMLRGYRISAHGISAIPYKMKTNLKGFITMEYNLGAYPTMITPFLPDGQIDYDMVKQYVHWYAENGCDGIFSVCQSSEIFFLSVEERVKLNKTVYDTARQIAANGGRKMSIVSSGHVSDSLEDQTYELNKIIESGTDALILITNRLDLNNEGDEVWIANAEKLLSMLPADVKLGLYECPHPYKRLVTPKILKWCVENGHFYYMKDTCCDMAMIKERLEIVKDTHFHLFNANCQTLLASMQAGGKGYCGIMCNFHPKLYSWLCANYEKEPEKAALVQSFIGTFGFIENGLSYPLTAKYSMNLYGNPTEVTARSKPGEKLSDYGKHCVAQMKIAADHMEKLLGV